VRNHLETLWEERDAIAAEVERLGLVRERPLVKGGVPIAEDLVANPLLRELRAVDQLIAGYGGAFEDGGNPFAQFAADAVRP
jgi:hypothetical protein